MTSKIKVAFIGAGKTSEQHIRVFNKINGVELSAIYNRTRRKAERIAIKYGIKKIFTSIDDMYLSEKPHLVVVAVSIEATKDLCLKIAKFPWKCLVEKPFGYNYEECIELINKIKKDQFYIGLNRSNYSSTIATLNLLKKDNSQRIISVTDQQSILNLEKKYTKKILVNFMYANSIHLVDYIRIFARGNISSINSIYDIKKKEMKIFSKKITFSSGDIVIFTSMWNKPGPWSVNISTNNFYFEMKPLEKLSYRYKKDNKNIELKMSKDDINYKPGFMRQAHEIIKAVEKKRCNIPSSDDVLKTTKIIKKIF